MNAVRERLLVLQERGWPTPAVARSVGVSVSTVEKWRTGERTPRTQTLLVPALDALLRRKRVPKRGQVTA